jgi:SAM-dependent methyltransferase
MPAYSACTDPGCTLAASRVVLRRSAPRGRDGRLESWPFEFRVCTRCEMGFVHPPPPPEVLAAAYTGAYAYYAAAGEHPAREAVSWKYRLARLRYRRLRLRRASGAAGALGEMMARLAEVLAGKTLTLTLGLPLTLPLTARILDYGYGSGSWLLAMRRLGYSRLAGFDIGANRERRDDLLAHGIEVVAEDRMELLPAASFDCVRLEHVFEHLSDPLGVLARLHRLLAPAGILVMTFPTIYPWLPAEDLPASPHLDHLQLPIHQAHHSIASATRLLRAGGFEVAVLRLTRRERFITLMAHKPGSGH